MKNWTVMVIPQGQGNTRSLNISTLHVWLVITCLAISAFATTYFYQRAATVEQRLHTMQAEAVLTQPQPAVAEPQSQAIPQQPATGDAAAQAEYETALRELQTRLDAIYVLEDELRERLELEPRKKAPSAFVGQALGSENGQGGPEDSGMNDYSGRRTRPDSIIQGLSRPSADMLLAELIFRRDSVDDLLVQVVAKQAAEQAAAEEKRRAALSLTPSRWPTNHPRAKMTSRFGNRRDPFTRRLKHPAGIAFSAPHGATILATADGKVTKAGWGGYYGNMVIVEHADGYETLYGPMSKVNVREGQAVKAGQLIGKVGSTGRSTGPHIHYEIHQNGRKINPYKYLKK